MYVRTTKTVKRLTIELPLEQYEFLRKKALEEGTSVSGLIRNLIEDRRFHVSGTKGKAYKEDSFYRRRGSFDGSADLSERHDAYLYGEESG